MLWVQIGKQHEKYFELTSFIARAKRQVFLLSGWVRSYRDERENCCRKAGRDILVKIIAKNIYIYIYIYI